MKRFVFTLLFFGLAFCYAQNTNYQKISTPYQYRHVLTDSVLGVPYGTIPVLRQTGGETRPGALFYRTTDSSLYRWTGTQWLKQSGNDGPVGPSKVYAGFGLQSVNDSTLKADTALMATKADRNHLKDSLSELMKLFKPVKITNSNFSSATKYNDPQFATGVKVVIDLNGVRIDSGTHYIQDGTGIDFVIPGFDAINNSYQIVIWRYVDGLAGIGLPINLTLPADIDVAYKVRRRPDGTFYTTYDWNALKNSITGTEIWVDPINGNNANSGTQLSPKKSINWVIQFSSAKIVNLVPGWYNYPDAFNGQDITRDMVFRCTGGVAWVTTADTVGAWSAVAGNPGAFESTYTGPASLESPVACDFSNKDVNGVPIRLTPVASIAAVASTPNSVFANATTNKFYVHTYDNRTPDDSIKVFFEKNAVEVFTPQNVVFENIRFAGGGSSGRALFSLDNTTPSGRINAVAKNCWFLYALYDGTQNYRLNTAYYKDCIFAYNGQDGNDWDKTSIGLEEDCIGHYNGYDGSGANNGSTCHGNSKVIRVNAVHKYNEGRNVHDIEDATSYNVNIVSDSSRGALGSDYAFGISSPGSANSTMYFIDCTSGTKGWDIRTTNGHGLYYNTNRASATNNLVGTVTDLSGYQFDPFPIVTSAAVTSSTAITITFSEPVTATNVGWSFKVNGISQTPSAIAGSGTNTLVFTVTTITSTDVVLRSYNPSTGNTSDAYGNELISFTDNPVTVAI